MLQCLQIPKFIYGKPQLLGLAAEIAGLGGLLVLVPLLRAALALPSAPRGFYRNVLDFLAMKNWHPSVIVSLIVLLVLPQTWYITHNPTLLQMVPLLGWRAPASGDVQDGMDGIAVTYQLALIAGVPFLFALHMLTRWKPKNRFLPWLLVPFLFVGTAMAIVLVVFVTH